MASQLGAEYTNLTANPQIHPPAQKWGGRVKRYHFTHTLTSALAQGETLTVFVIPPKCRAVGGKINFPALMTAATTINVGTAANAVKYGDAIAVGNAQIEVSFANYPGTAVAGFGGNFGSETAGPEAIQIATASAAALTTGKLISGYMDVQIGD